MMLNRFIPMTVALFLATMSPSVWAFFDPPWVTPAAPRAGEVVSINISGGVCDAIFEHPGFPQITRQGNSINLLEYGDHAATDDLCVYGIGHLVQPIGVFTPGDYTVTVDFTYENYPFGYETVTLGVVPFTVAGATSAASGPVVSSSWKFVLLTLIFGMAARALCMRRRNHC
jgi:hypothetical protein